MVDIFALLSSGLPSRIHAFHRSTPIQLGEGGIDAHGDISVIRAIDEYVPATRSALKNPCLPMHDTPILLDHSPSFVEKFGKRPKNS